MSAKFDCAEAERAVADFERLGNAAPEFTRDYEDARFRCAYLLPAALSEIRRLLGVVHESHLAIVHDRGMSTICKKRTDDLLCACPDCAAFRSTRETT